MAPAKRTSTSDDTYDASAISVLKGLDAVRKRPGMYIGSTDSRGLVHCLVEILDNSVDEAAAGHASEITVILHDDDSYEVRDNGRGIPVDAEASTGKSALELVFTELHAGGKFGGGGYAASGGLHGVGASVVNALSSRLEAEVDRNGTTHLISFKTGVAGAWTGDKFRAKSGPRKGPKVAKATTGTRVRFWPDRRIFEADAAIDVAVVAERARQIAFLVPGVTLIVDDRRSGTPEIQTFEATDGLVDFAASLSPLNNATDIIHLTGEGTYTETVPVLDGDDLITQDVERVMKVDIALRWTAGYVSEQRSFVNTIVTPKGGTHVTGFERALVRSVNDALRETKTLRDKDENVIKDDVLEGLVSVVKVEIVEPQFEGQTKEILGTSAATKIVSQVVTDGMRAWFARNAKRTQGKAALAKVANAAKARLAARTQRETVRRKNALESASMPAKLADCRTHDLARSELFLIEGDSAAGSAKGARDSEFQALLPLRGKILNVAKAPLKSMLDNAECQALITAIGGGFGKAFDESSIRYSRVILMSVAPDEPVLVSGSDGHLRRTTIGEVVDDRVPTNDDRAECSDLSVAHFDKLAGSSHHAAASHVIRHHYAGDMWTVRTAYGRSVAVTTGHSVYIYEPGTGIVAKAGDQIRVGDLVVAPRRIAASPHRIERIDYLELLRKHGVAGLRVSGPSVAAAARQRLAASGSRAMEPRVHVEAGARATLVELRKSAGITQQQMATQCGRAQAASISEYETGRRPWPVSVLAEYEATFDTPIHPRNDSHVLADAYPASSGNQRHRATGTAAWLEDLTDADLDSISDDVVITSSRRQRQGLPRYQAVDEALGLVLGWFTAEGTTSGGQISFAVGPTDTPYLDELRTALSAVTGEEPRLWKPADCGSWQLYLHNLPFTHVLEAIGARGIAPQKRVPELILNAPEATQIAYLRGLFLGDGAKTAGYGGTVTWVTASEDLAEDLAAILGTLGVFASKETCRSDRTTPTGTYPNYESFKVVVRDADGLSKLRTVWAGCPLEARNADAVRSGKKLRDAVPISEDLVGLPVRSNTPAPYDGPVYDFSVPEHHTFYAGRGGMLGVSNTDADVDGSHIRTLLLTFFYYYMRPLLDAGRIYSAMPPLFNIYVSGSRTPIYAYTDEHRDEIYAELAAAGKTVKNVQRNKGLGEMDAHELAETTVAPETRKLRRITVNDAEAAATMFDVLMGDDVPPRKEYIVENALRVDASKLDT